MREQWLRDHPRSRGVYRGDSRRNRSRGGSSPLARGLPLPPGLDLLHGRIIPARAGFTLAPFLGSVRWPDHPRSRGVYDPHRRGRRSVRGSSPLARGLLIQLEGGSADGRIIPARAGFTQRRKRRWPARPDHPRSRGVYSVTRSATGVSGGSSPLARGLRPRLVGRQVRNRIIPARAGFTEVAARQAGPRPDHPRSRGVYPSKYLGMFQCGGSSPLARGLQRSDDEGADQLRIIPARAGFTNNIGETLDD